MLKYYWISKKKILVKVALININLFNLDSMHIRHPVSETQHSQLLSNL